MDATVGVTVAMAYPNPTAAATVVTGVQIIYLFNTYIQATIQTEHANTRFWQCTSRTGDRMVSSRFVGSGGAYMQKPVYTHPTLREDATQDVIMYLF